MPITPATQEMEVGGSRTDVNLGKSARPYLKKEETNKKEKELGA
jgi:hypothetical protein